MRKSIKILIRFELIHQGVYNIFSDLYTRWKKVLKKYLFPERDLFLVQISLRILLEKDPNFDFISEITSRVDKYSKRLNPLMRLFVIDSVTQKIFYNDLNIIGNMIKLLFILD